MGIQGDENTVLVLDKGRVSRECGLIAVYFGKTGTRSPDEMKILPYSIFCLISFKKLSKQLLDKSLFVSPESDCQL